MIPVERAFYARDSRFVARALLGKVLVRDDGRAARIVETEAYRGELDPGSHAFRGMTARNRTMFGPPGGLYVYFTYGMHWCLNLVCEAAGTPGAVLLRAGEVVAGVEAATHRRPTARSARDLARGPARLAAALGVDRSHDGADVCAAASPITVRHGVRPSRDAVVRGPRTGVGDAGAERPWRFWVEGEPSVSPYRAHVPRRRGTATGTAYGTAYGTLGR